MIYYSTILLYNLLSILAILLFFPLLVLLVAGKKKYRSRIGARLGKGLGAVPLAPGKTHSPTIWLHALSVGETTSSLALVKGIRKTYPTAVIIFSTTTSSGERLAKERVQPYVDAVIAAPLDLFFSIRSFIHTLQPDLFILTETDFWPNWLFFLRRAGIPSVLVNGRISRTSFIRYRRLRWFFRPLFSQFSALCMQTENDRNKMIQLGVPAERVHTLGNLKFDTHLPTAARSMPASLYRQLGLQPGAPIWICGSTHAGEESILLSVHARLKKQIPGLQLIVAPRDIDRSDDVLNIARSSGLACRKRSVLTAAAPAEVLILDTIGELAVLYQIADAAFIGGSLIEQGGHNPLEAAICGIPVLFGKHMEDFSEIASGLVDSGGGVEIESGERLFEVLLGLFSSSSRRRQQGTMAKQWVHKHQGVVNQHLQLLQPLLTPDGPQLN